MKTSWPNSIRGSTLFSYSSSRSSDSNCASSSTSSSCTIIIIVTVNVIDITRALSDLQVLQINNISSLFVFVQQ